MTSANQEKPLEELPPIPEWLVGSRTDSCTSGQAAQLYLVPATKVASHDKVDLSIVIPVFNEKESLEPLYAQLQPVLSSLGKAYEIIFVDDGSTDGSFTVLQSLHTRDERVRVIRLRRNFGQTAALHRMQDTLSQEIQVRTPEHLPLDELHTVNMSP